MSYGEHIRLNWVPVAVKVSEIGRIISTGILGDENKLPRIKSAQKISHVENNYTMFSETKSVWILTKTNLPNLPITNIPVSILNHNSGESV